MPPWPDGPCPTCPRAAKGLPLPCRAMAPAPGQHGHQRFCDLANPAHPDHQPKIRRMLADEPEPVPQSPRPPETRNPHHERLMLVWGCDYRTELEECGCTKRAHCGLRRGFFETEPYAVALAECLRCVTQADPPRSS